MTGIQHISTATPGTSTSIADLPERNALSGAELEYYDTCGIQNVYHSDVSSLELARLAGEKLLAESGTNASEIDVLIHIKARMPEKFISSETAHLKSALGLEKAMIFGLSDLGCADSSMAIKLGLDLLKANRSMQKVMVTFGSKNYTPQRFRYPVTITGDGGVAVLLQRDARYPVQEMQFDTNGKYWDLFQVDHRETAFAEYKEICTDVRKYGFELAIESRNRFQDMHSRILSNQNLEKQDIQHHLLQNISERAYTFYEEAMGLSFSPVCRMNLQRFGHLGPGDILFNLKALLDSGLTQTNDRILIMNNSPVATWSALLLQITDQ
jgi:3-oxoacyl-[acyl-carrier-protein] synthase-3